MRRNNRNKMQRKSRRSSTRGGRCRIRIYIGREADEGGGAGGGGGGGGGIPANQ